jgi:hypothetical protein
MDRAETYLRLLAEMALRGTQDALESVARLHRAGEILVVAGALTPRQVTSVISGFELSLLARSGTDALGLARGLRRLSNLPRGDEEPDGAADTGPPRVVPVGAVISGDRFALHLMTLACLPGRAVISAALRMRWPADGPDADLAASLGAGPHQLPYGAPRGAAAEFIPFAVVLPALDGARFAVTGLASADGESVLHVAATGHVRGRPHWGTGFSWWIKDGAGGWHVAGIAEELDQWGYRDVVLRMPLVPPLPVPLGQAALAVAGPAEHVHAILGRQ